MHFPPGIEGSCETRLACGGHQTLPCATRLAQTFNSEFYPVEHLKMPSCQPPSHSRSTLAHMRDAPPTIPSYIPLNAMPASDTPTHLCICQPGEEFAYVAPLFHHGMLHPRISVPWGVANDNSFWIGVDDGMAQKYTDPVGMYKLSTPFSPISEPPSVDTYFDTERHACPQPAALTDR